MGPLQTMLKVPGGIPPNSQANGLGYNPRCLSRDINLQAANSTSDFEVSSLIQIKDIARFQTVYQGEFAKNFMGVHTVGLPSNTCHAWILTYIQGGHYTIGGDAGSDFYNSPADPAFFPHHGMIDRVWW